MKPSERLKEIEESGNMDRKSPTLIIINLLEEITEILDQLYSEIETLKKGK